MKQEIDFLELGKKMWRERKLFVKTCGVAAVVGLVVGFSIPKEYTTVVTLAPEMESGGKSSSGGLSALAGLAGINIGALQSADALSPTIYPDIVRSIPFAVEMLDVVVTDIKGEMNTTVYDYLNKHQKKPWWKHIMDIPGKIIGMVTGSGKDGETEGDSKKVDAFRLTREQSGVISELTKRIEVEEDKKTQLINISATMQDPLISATMAKEVTEKLQDYITEYRTNKARMDLKYTQKLFDESRERYHKLQQEYATYMDRNQNISLRSAQTHQERLRNEMDLAYSVYNQTAQQLQVAKAKVQENTPVYTVVEAATVPLIAARPRKSLILIAFMFMAFVGTAGWITIKKDEK